MSITSIKPTLHNTLLSQLITNPEHFPNSVELLISPILRDNYLPRSIKDCRIAVFKLNRIYHGLSSLFAQDPELLLNSLIAICNKHLQQGLIGIAFRYWNNEQEVVLLIWDQLNSSPRLLEQINSDVYQSLGSRIHFGLGNTNIFPAGLPHSYSNAVIALKQSNLLDPAKSIHQDYSIYVLQTYVLDTSSFLEEFRYNLQHGDNKKWNQTINRWFDSIRQLSYLSHSQIKQWEHIFNQARIQWHKNAQPTITNEYMALLQQFSFTIPYDEKGCIKVELWQEHWEKTFNKLYSYLNSKLHVIHDVKQFLDTYYPDPITLQSIAAHFTLSREYISRRFKQEFKENLFEYLTRVRIEKAKHLLVHSHLKIEQIAIITGYKNYKYFNLVFKSKTGQSPSLFRKDPN